MSLTESNRCAKALLCVAPALFMTADTSLAQTPAAGTSTCTLTQTENTTTQYSTNVLKAVFSFGGLLFSTQTCLDVTTKSTKYTYVGPGMPMGISDSADPTAFQVPILHGEAPCYGDPVSPTANMSMNLCRVTSLSGQTLDVPFIPMQGSLYDFLGANFDPTSFDPAHLASTAWTGYSVILPAAFATSPTLTFANPDFPHEPVQNTMDVGVPNRTKLDVDLSAQAAGSLLLMVTSSSLTDGNNLFNFGGVSVPITPDWFTDAFLATFSPLVGIADGNGDASFDFPHLAGNVFDGIDVRLAVLALSPAGAPVESSTQVTIGLRDLKHCR